MNLRLYSICFLLLTIMLICVGCVKTDDRKAYEDVVSTLSTTKAKEFFIKYPDSKYRDILANDLLLLCQHENTRECYQLVIEALPKNHKRYKETVDYYNRTFVKKQ